MAETGTPHLQGYVAYTKKVRFGTVKRDLPDGAHIEQKVKHSTPSQAAEYCKKDGDYQEFGQCPGGAGTRSDLAELYQSIQDGARREDIGGEFPGQYIRYGRRIDELIRRRSDRPRDRTTTVRVYAICGRTGVGKSRFVWDKFGQDLYVHGTNPRFFDGYDGHSVALFDDYDGSVFKLSYFLRILDRYPLRVEIKGDTINWRPDIIFITSNKKVQDWYPNSYFEHQEALQRRIEKEFWCETNTDEVDAFFTQEAEGEQESQSQRHSSQQ